MEMAVPLKKQVRLVNTELKHSRYMGVDQKKYIQFRESWLGTSSRVMGMAQKEVVQLRRSWFQV